MFPWPSESHFVSVAPPPECLHIEAAQRRLHRPAAAGGDRAAGSSLGQRSVLVQLAAVCRAGDRAAGGEAVWIRGQSLSSNLDQRSVLVQPAFPSRFDGGGGGVAGGDGDDCGVGGGCGAAGGEGDDCSVEGGCEEHG